MAFKTAFALVALMLAAYLIGRRYWARYAVPGVLLVSTLHAALSGQMHMQGVQWNVTIPVLTAPEFSLAAIVSLALSLFVVTMASQNLPGVAPMRASGFRLPLSNIITLTGVATMLLAPFGAFALNFSAITAAIYMDREAHSDTTHRCIAPVVCGAIYCVIGTFGATVTGVLSAFPRELVAAIAGFALLGTIGTGLGSALKEDTHREAALITFLVTLSGLSLWGIGAAFWGVVAGALALFVQQWPTRPVPSITTSQKS